MKRTDITELFPEATSEQIDKIMGINGADINAAKREVGTLQTQLAELQVQMNKPSEELTAAKNKVQTLQAEIDSMKAAEAIRVMRQKVSTASGVPADLLTGTTEEECTTQAQGIMAFKSANGYPSVKDAGETHVDVPKSTRDSFADWFNKIQ